MGFGNIGKLAGSTLGAIGGSFLGNPAAGAMIGAEIGGIFGPSDERLANRSRVQSLRDNLYMWNMANEYNSPAQQKKRLEEAGLNPMIMYEHGSVDNSTSVPSAPASSYSGSSRASRAVGRFFLNKSMQNAEDQNTRNELINENWRLRNLKLARDIDKKGGASIAEKIRRNKPLSLSEAKYANKLIQDATQPVGMSGSSVWTAGPRMLENISYKLTDWFASKYYKDYNLNGHPSAELY